jgi:hypothetical protein
MYTRKTFKTVIKILNKIKMLRTKLMETAQIQAQIQI